MRAAVRGFDAGERHEVGRSCTGGHRRDRGARGRRRCPRPPEPRPSRSRSSATRPTALCDADCSLREAVIAANAAAGADVIALPAGTLTLSIAGVAEQAAATGDLDILAAGGTVTVRGAGVAATTIDANQVDRVFEVLAGARLELADLTVSDGHRERLGRARRHRRAGREPRHRARGADAAPRGRLGRLRRRRRRRHGRRLGVPRQRRGSGIRRRDVRRLGAVSERHLHGDRDPHGVHREPREPSAAPGSTSTTTHGSR